MIKMTPRWRNAAIVMAVIGFVALAIKGSPVEGAVNAALWFGIVYAVFLVGYVLRKALGGGSKPPLTIASVAVVPDALKPEIRPEP